MDVLKFKTDLTLDDYKSLCRFQARVSLALVSLAGGIFIAFVLTRFFVNAIPLLALIGVVGGAAVYLIVSLYINWRAGRIYNMSDVSAELLLTINEQGITQVSQKSEISLEWGDVYKVAEIKKCYFVFLNRSKAFYFPKRSFDSSEHEKAFVEWVVEKVHPGRIKFKR